MKQLLFGSFFVSLLFIFGCSDQAKDTKEPVDYTEQNNQQQTNQSDSQQLTEQQKIHQQLSDVLLDIVETYGIMEDKMEYFNAEYESGVVYTSLVDFDTDGTNELYVLFKSSSYQDASYEHRKRDDYVQEIWGKSGDTVELFDVTTFDLQTCDDCSHATSIVQMANGQSALVDEVTKLKSGETETTELYKTIQNGQMATLTLLMNAADENTYEIDGKVVDEQAYNDARANYQGDYLKIITSSFGKKVFTFNEDSSAVTVSRVFEGLDNGYEAIAKTFEPVNTSEFQQYVNQITNIPYFDVNNEADTDRLVSYVLYYGGLISDGQSTDSHVVYSKDLVAQKYEELFGVPLNVEALQLPKLDLENFSLIAYEDEMFYVLATEMYSLLYDREVLQAFDLGEDTYYVTLNDLEFNAYYVAMDDGNVVEPDSFIHESFDKWPDDARNFATSGIKRYLVIKLVDGKPTFRYLGYANLTKEQLENY